MKSFNYHQSTKILFGKGKISELPDIVLKYSKKVLLVTTPASIPALEEQYIKVKRILGERGIEVTHFDGVKSNPTVEVITEGALLAKKSDAKVIIGLGGGSSIDTAKAISVEATHNGISWDYLFFKSPQPDPNRLLPVIAVSTTSGTGSQVTQVAVITNTKERAKSALSNNILYPMACIIDPELMLSVPKFVTATTGFDVFCHSFESTLHFNSSVYTDLLAWEAISLVIDNLPSLLNDLNNVDLREKLAWADTLAGLCIANAGVTLPHGIAMAIGGMYPHVAHGEALAIAYPAFTEFTWKAAVPQFSRVARLLNGELNSVSDHEAASQSSMEILKFLKSIGQYKRLREVRMPEEEIAKLAEQSMVLPDYKGNPKVATKDEMINIIKSSY
jgi:alcohol dehydrogenase class IV